MLVVRIPAFGIMFVVGGPFKAAPLHWASLICWARLCSCKVFLQLHPVPWWASARETTVLWFPSQATQTLWSGIFSLISGAREIVGVFLPPPLSSIPKGKIKQNIYTHAGALYLSTSNLNLALFLHPLLGLTQPWNKHTFWFLKLHFKKRLTIIMAIIMVSRQKWNCFPSVCSSKGGSLTFSSINCMDTFHQEGIELKKKKKPKQGCKQDFNLIL